MADVESAIVVGPSQAQLGAAFVNDFKAVTDYVVANPLPAVPDRPRVRAHGQMSYFSVTDAAWIPYTLIQNLCLMGPWVLGAVSDTLYGVGGNKHVVNFVDMTVAIHNGKEEPAALPTIAAIKFVATEIRWSLPLSLLHAFFVCRCSFLLCVVLGGCDM